MFPIGAHGETKLNEALRALKEFSTIGNILWFGIGVKHPLRQMATTSGGASCVALIACLSEFYHNPPYCAKVLYEMARQSKGADDMLALQQWESLVKICCRVFASSTFGVQVQTLLKLTVYSPMAFSTEGYDDPANPAEILRLLGQVLSGKLRGVTIAGGPECCWLFVLCDFLLGLKVRLQKGSETLNQKGSTGSIQIQLRIREYNSSMPAFI